MFLRWNKQKKGLSRYHQPLSLKLVLTLPFVVPLVVTMGLVGYLSYRSGQQTVEELAQQLMTEVGDRIDQTFSHFLRTPIEINQSNAFAIQMGVLDWQDFATLKQYFDKQLDIYNVTAVGITTEDQKFLVLHKQDDGLRVLRSIDESTNSTNDYALENRLVEQQGNPTWQLISSVVHYQAPVLVAVNFVPFYDRNNTFRGVVSTGVSLTRFSSFLQRLEVGRTGQAFVIERTGQMISTSTGELPFHQNTTGSQINPWSVQAEPAPKRLSVFDSRNFITQATAHQLRDRFGSFNWINNQSLTMQIQGQRYFVQVKPFSQDPDLNWLQVVVIPEADFMAEIQANARRTILLCSLTLFSLVGLGLWIAQRISQPILRINRATQAFSAGEAVVPLAPTRIQEVDTLRLAFNQMMIQLDASFQALQENHHTLETFLNSVPVGVSVHAPSGRVIFINQKGKELLKPGVTSATADQLSEVYHLYRAGTNQLYPTAELPAIRGLNGESVYVDDIEIEIGGRRVPVEINTTPVFDQDGYVLYAINAFRDITEQRQAEQLRANYQRELEHQVAAQTQALRESQTELQLITDSVPGCISYADASQRYRFINRTFEVWFNCVKEEILGKTVEQFIGKEAYKRVHQYIERVLRGERVTYEMEIPYQNYQTRYISAVLVPDLDEHQSIQGYYALLTDISDRKRAEDEHKLAQDALKRSEERLRLLTDALPVYISYADTDQRYRFVNKTYETQFGLSRDEICGRHTRDLIGEVNYSLVQGYIERALAGETVTYEVTVPKEGYDSSFLVTLVPDMDTHANVRGYYSLVVDITDRKQAEEQLRVESDFRLAIESAIVEGVAMVDLDRRQNYVNPAFCQMVGWSAEELLGATPPFVYWPPEEVETITRALQRCLEGDRPTRGMELRFMRRNGERFDVLILDAPLRNAQGEITAWLASVYDITDRKQSEAALQQALLELNYHIDHSPLATIRWDRNFRVECWSKQAEAMFGWKEEEVLGKTLEGWRFIVEEDRATVRQCAEQLLNGRSTHCRNRNYCKDGSIVYCEWYNSALLDESGQLISILSLAQDVSDRKRAEAALKQSETRFLEISESSPANIYILVRRVDGSFYFEHISRAIETIHEISAAQILENADILLNHIHPEDRADYEAAVKRSLDTLQPFQHEWRIINPSGKIKWLQGSSRPVPRTNGDIAWYGVVIDITDRKSAELALQRYERIVSATTDAISLVDRHYCYQIVNQAYLDWYQRSYADIVGHSVSELMGQEVFETMIQARLDRCLAGETVQYNEWFELPSLGRQFLSVTYSPYLETNQTISGIVVSVRNITPLKQTEDALRQSEERFQEIAQTISQLFFVRSAKTGQFLYVSPPYEQIWGRSCESLYRHPESWMESIHPDDRSQIEHSLTHQFEGQPVNREYRIIRSDGQIRWIFAQITVIRDAIGNPDRFIGFATDITNRKRFEEALQESEERFRNAFQDAPIGMALLALDDCWLKINPTLCNMLGYLEAELLLISVSSVVHPDDRPKFRHYVEQVFSDRNHAAQIEVRYCCHEGRTVWGLTSLSLVRDAQARPFYYVAQIQDITEQQAIDRMKDEFISIVSHELRTPLTAIQGFLGLLNTGIYDDKPEKAKRMIDQALKNSERLTRLVNDILDLERLSSGKVQLVMEECDAEDLMRRAIAEVQPIADTATVTLSLIPTTAQVWAAPDAIIQTLTNLLSNAIKFSPPHAEVILSTQLQENKVLFCVQDHGRGIPPEKLETIFGRFQQVDVSDSRQKGGTGLGLAICHSIVQQHGGNIWAESTLGEGSRFYFTLTALTASP